MWFYHICTLHIYLLWLTINATASQQKLDLCPRIRTNNPIDILTIKSILLLPCSGSLSKCLFTKAYIFQSCIRKQHVINLIIILTPAQFLLVMSVSANCVSNIYTGEL